MGLLIRATTFDQQFFPVDNDAEFGDRFFLNHGGGTFYELENHVTGVVVSLRVVEVDRVAEAIVGFVVDENHKFYSFVFLFQ